MVSLFSSADILFMSILILFCSFFVFFFFFSSRRRHTRWNCDWSSDVCSSDLFVAVRSARWPDHHSGMLQGLLVWALSFTVAAAVLGFGVTGVLAHAQTITGGRSEEHTSELQSQFHLVCRLLLEKKNKKCSAEF